MCWKSFWKGQIMNMSVSVAVVVLLMVWYHLVVHSQYQYQLNERTGQHEWAVNTFMKMKCYDNGVKQKRVAKRLLTNYLITASIGHRSSSGCGAPIYKQYDDRKNDNSVVNNRSASINHEATLANLLGKCDRKFLKVLGVGEKTCITLWSPLGLKVALHCNLKHLI